MGYRIDDPASAEPRADRRPTPRAVAAKTVAVLPTLFTLGNLLCGFTAVFLASRAESGDLPFGWTTLTYGAIFIFLGMVADGLDGRIARLTKSSSDLGEQLDSMADMVTFGVAPAFLAVQLAIRTDLPFLSHAGDTTFGRFALAVALIYVACAALRLARFNIETGEDEQKGPHEAFSGLPSPGAAGTVAAMILLHEHFLARSAELWATQVAALAMVGITLLVAIAMVSRLRYVHIMNRYVRGRAPFESLVGGIILGLLLVTHPQWALAVGLTIYALSAPATATYRVVTGKRNPDDMPADDLAA